MAYIHPKQVQDRKVKKLHKRLKAVEQQMSEQAILRRKIEELSVMDAVKTQMAIEKANNSAMLLKGEIERIYGTPKRSPSPPPNNKVVEEIISKRTKDFHHSQAQKAANIQFLSQERQRILDARHRLKEKQTMFRSLPSPVGKATHRFWGHKYDLYTPLFYDHFNHTYTPVFEDGYYTHFPSVRRRRLPWYNNRVSYVPMPLFQSLW